MTCPMRPAAQGRLSFERAGARTVIREAYAESPLRLLTPRNHGSSAWAYTSTLGGGLVDGDRIRLDVAVAEGASAFVSTQGPTRVFRSPSGCESSVSARVAPAGTLVLAPDPTACFAGARLRQRSDVELRDGASVALWDVLSAGRSARGERWAFSQCAVELRLRRDGRTLIDERWLLDPAHGALGDRLGRFEAFGTLLLCGPAFSSLRVSVGRHIAEEPVAPRSGLVEAASAIADDVLLVRLASPSVERLVHSLRDRCAALVHPLGDDPFSRRA